MNAHVEQLDLRTLLTALSDGVITDGQWAQLETLLQRDGDAQQQYLDAITHEALLQREFTGAASRGLSEAKPRIKGVQRSGFRVQVTALALAAAVAIAVTAWFIWPAASNPQSAIRHSQYIAPVATVIDAHGDLLFGDTVAYPGRDYPAGPVALDAGAAEFMLAGGTMVQLHGPARLDVRDPMHVSLTAGSASFRCPDGVDGFTVITPRAEIVDLGTAFASMVEPGGGESIMVLDGRVRITARAGAGDSVTLEAGQRVSISAAGRIVPSNTPLPSKDDKLLAWLRADAIEANGTEQAIARWPDQSAHQHDALLDGAAPTRMLDDAAGFPFVRFVDDQRLLAPDLLDNRSVGDLTIIAVYRTAASDDHLRGVGLGRLETYEDKRLSRHINLSTDGTLRFDGSNIADGYQREHPTGWFVRVVTLDDGVFTEHYNGAPALGPTPARRGQTVDDLYLGAVLKPFSEAAPFDLAEVIIYDAALTPTQRRWIEKQLIERYELDRSTTHTRRIP